MFTYQQLSEEAKEKAYENFLKWRDLVWDEYDADQVTSAIKKLKLTNGFFKKTANLFHND